MDLNPTQSDFDKAYNDGHAQVVRTTLVGDLDTPVSAYLKLVGQDNLGFLLESVEGGANRGRYGDCRCACGA